MISREDQEELSRVADRYEAVLYAAGSPGPKAERDLALLRKISYPSTQDIERPEDKELDDEFHGCLVILPCEDGKKVEGEGETVGDALNRAFDKGGLWR